MSTTLSNNNDSSSSKNNNAVQVTLTMRMLMLGKVGVNQYNVLDN